MTEPLSTFSINAIVARASSIAEAARWPIAADALKDAAGLVDRWESRLGRMHVNPSLFDDRLRSLGITRSEAIDRYACRVRPSDQPLPEWAQYLEQTLADHRANLRFPKERTSVAHSSTDGVSSTQYGLTFPVFDELAGPFVRRARQDLLAIPEVTRLLNARALAIILTNLKHRISNLAARTMVKELKKQAQGIGSISSTSQKRYAAFMTRFAESSDAVESLFVSYPVLARLIATRTKQSVDAVAEMAQRLADDASAIADRFHAGQPFGRIDSLQLGMSDPHAKGRSVTIIESENHLKIVYKPRSLAIDDAYARLIDWWNAACPQVDLRAAKVLTREDYGWAEFIELRPCESRDSVRRFYRRQGAQLAILDTLQATDFHSDNFIAHAEFPVPIDLECLLTATRSNKSNSRETPAAYRPNSLFLTSMLPSWQAGGEGQICSANSGIVGRAHRARTESRAVWKHLETDQLTLAFESSSVDEENSSCLPRLAGNVIGAEGYIDDLQTGYSIASTAILRQREELTSPTGPLNGFRHLKTRCLLRSTHEYLFLLGWSTSPDHLVSGPAYDAALELLATYGAFRNVSLEIIDAEKTQLWDRDVPVFYSEVDGTRIVDPEGRVVISDLVPSIYEQAIDGIQSIQPEDLEWNSQVLKSSARLACHVPPVDLDSIQESKPDDDILLEEATRLGNELVELAMESRQGVTWLSLVQEPHDDRALSMRTVEDGLYSGNAGIALFLMNLGIQTQQNRFIELAREGLRFAVEKDRWLRRVWPEFTKRLHAFGSAYSTVYSLTEGTRLLKDPDMLEQAIAHAQQQQTPKEIVHSDFLNGAAGTLCVLAHLYQFAKADWLLDRAIELAGIIERSKRSFGGWLVGDFPHPLLGLGHGQCGIAMALSRLSRLAGNRRWDAMIDESMTYEASQFDTQHRNWPNLQKPGKPPSFMEGWCAGAPGHGLARLELLATQPSRRETAAEIQTAIDVCQRQGAADLSIARPENLCCGKPGNFWFLSAAGHQLHREDWIIAARDQAVELIRDRYARGAWHLRPVTERDTLPGLMGGIAGVGLSLLQARRPATVSQVVTLA